MNLTNRFRFFTTIAVLATSTTLLSSAAFARATVSPALRTATGQTTVIAVFKNKLRPVRSAQSSTGYLKFRRALEANSEESQRGLISFLKKKGLLGSEIRMKSLWLVNAAIIELPASKLELIEYHPDVRAIYKNSKLSIIRDFSEKPLKLHPSMDPEFTYGLNVINVPRLRSTDSKANGDGVLVGILDTGIDAKHPDLEGKTVGFRDFVGNKNAPYDDNGHGTHVAGTIAGGKNSGKSIGVAPGAKVLIGKVFTGGGSGTLDGILKGMQWMADPDGDPKTADEPSLVSNSWGGGSPDASMDPADDVLCQAVSSWVDLGIFPVFAAGNSGPGKSSIGIPGACPDAYAIGATDESDALASFSSRGPAVWKTGGVTKPNVSAPGVAVISSVPGGGYKSLSGTSMATPHVAGLMALIYQAMPTLTIGDAADLVGRTTKDLGKGGNDDEFGMGRIDAFNAVSATRSFRRRQ